MKLQWFVLLLMLTLSMLYSAADLEQQYLQAKQSIEKKEYFPILLNLAQKHENTRYGQLALEELAKIYLLDRDYEEAISALKKIHLPEIRNKQYWLAKAYLKSGKFQEAIISAQIFIANSDQTENIESSYFIIAEAYLNQKKYQKALNTLESLRTSRYISNHIPLLHYKRGICYEMMKEYENAILCYRKLKSDFPYHQYSYLAEDRIFNLRTDKDIEVDLTKLNIHRQTEPKLETKAATGQDLKIFLQVGAFSSLDNAEKLGKKVSTIGYHYKIFPVIKNNQQLFTVAAGPFEDDNKLKKAMQKLEKNGLESFLIKRYD